MTKMFWTDINQARDRLNNTYLMLGKDPVYIRDFSSTGEVYVHNYRLGGKPAEPVPLEAFGDFRKLPPLGWINLLGKDVPDAVYAERVPLINRSHGLRGDGVAVFQFEGGVLDYTRNHSLGTILADKGYLLTVDGDYPTIEDVVENIPPNCTTAVSRKLAVASGSDGLSWLYRRRERLGFFTKNSLRIFPTLSFYRDELICEGGFENIQIKEVE